MAERITRRGALILIGAAASSLILPEQISGQETASPPDVTQSLAEITLYKRGYNAPDVPVAVFYTLNGEDGISVPRMMDYFYRQQGGRAIWGDPISRQWTDRLNRFNQVFKKGILQLTRNPNNRVFSTFYDESIYSLGFANIFDDLSALGKDAWLDAEKQIPPPFDWSSDQGKEWPEVIDNHLSILESYPALADFITSDNNWIDHYGLPTGSKEYNDRVTLRMQKASLQLLKRDLPSGQEGSVLVMNGGSIAKESGVIIPEYARNPQQLKSGYLAPEIPSQFPKEIGSLPTDKVLIHNVGTRAGLVLNDPEFLKKYFTPMMNAVRPTGAEIFVYDVPISPELGFFKDPKFQFDPKYKGLKIQDITKETFWTSVGENPYLQTSGLIILIRKDGVAELHLSLLPKGFATALDHIDASYSFLEILRDYLPLPGKEHEAEFKAVTDYLATKILDAVWLGSTDPMPISLAFRN